MFPVQNNALQYDTHTHARARVNRPTHTQGKMNTKAKSFNKGENPTSMSYNIPRF